MPPDQHATTRHPLFHNRYTGKTCHNLHIITFNLHMLTTALFDLDDTLYTPDTGLWTTLRARITHYMVDKVGLDPDTALALRQRYYHTFGAALPGLMQEYNVNPDDFMDYVHAVPIEDYLQPDPALNAMLARLPLTKVIFTNADVPHAERVLKRLGIARHFSAILDVRARGYIFKPDPQAYAQTFAHLRLAPAQCVYLDDAAHNLRPAQALGCLTVLVNPEPTASLAGVDYHIAQVHHAERILAAHLGQTG